MLPPLLCGYSSYSSCLSILKCHFSSLLPLMEKNRLLRKPWAMFSMFWLFVDPLITIKQGIKGREEFSKVLNSITKDIPYDVEMQRQPREVSSTYISDRHCKWIMSWKAARAQEIVFLKWQEPFNDSKFLSEIKFHLFYHQHSCEYAIGWRAWDIPVSEESKVWITQRAKEGYVYIWWGYITLAMKKLYTYSNMKAIIWKVWD